MANGRAGNVLYIDTTGYSETRTVKICGVKYLGAASGTASIADASGVVIWQEAGTNNIPVEDLDARVDGFTVTLANSAKVIIYLES